jgi:hypothetical protein
VRLPQIGGWYGFCARLDALWCLLRRHQVTWRTERDIEADCPGDILCHTCGEDGVLHWCRWYDKTRKRVQP